MITQFSISKDQTEVINGLIEWLNKPDHPFITVGGYAGTGKTTILSVLRRLIHTTHPKKTIAFACYTGKASQVLKLKLQEQDALYPKDFCGTLHSLMYSAVLDDQGKIKTWNRNKKLTCDLLVIDEASMVTSSIWNDLLSYQIPIIAVGDHGQLPPIDATGFNLMQTPRLTLEHIHRQAQHNPIIQIATIARQTGQIPFKQYSSTVMKVKNFTDEAEMLIERIASNQQEDTLVLCARNKTRVLLNQKIRNHRSIEFEEPLKGEILICLKNNYETSCGPIYNGMLGKVTSIAPKDDHWYQASIEFIDDGRVFNGLISKYQFLQEKYVDSIPGIHYSKIGDRFDFGYALTVHKAQGSQAKKVLLFEEYSPYMKGEEWNRWLYTAVTRASEELYIIG